MMVSYLVLFMFFFDVVLYNLGILDLYLWYSGIVVFFGCF